MSVRNYAILWPKARTTGGSSIAGGNAITSTEQHALDGPEHTGDLPIERLSTSETDTTMVLAPDGAGGVEARPETGGAEVLVEHGVLGTTETFDVTDGVFHAGELNDDCTITPAGDAADGVVRQMVLKLASGDGTHTVTWVDIIWPDNEEPVLSTDADAVDTVVLTHFGDAGDWFGAFDRTGGTGVTYGTPAIVLGTVAAAGSTDEAIRRDSTIVAFDATAPVTQAFGDAAATGSAAVAARRDHRHGMPSSSVTAAAIQALGFVGPLLIADSPSTPLVFADLLQNEDQDDLIYQDL